MTFYNTNTLHSRTFLKVSTNMTAITKKSSVFCEIQKVIWSRNDHFSDLSELQVQLLHAELKSVLCQVKRIQLT